MIFTYNKTPTIPMTNAVLSSLYSHRHTYLNSED